MTKHGRGDDSEANAAILKIRDRKPLEISPVELSQRMKMLRLRSKLQKRLLPVFAKAGLDIENINNIIADYQREAQSVFEREKSKSATTLAALRNRLEQGMANQKKALEYLASGPIHPIVTPITLFTAQIWATPAGMLVDSHIEPFNNWAKIAYLNRQNGSASAYVRFYFYWKNESQYLAVLTASSSLLLQGALQATAQYGFFSGGSSDMRLWARLTAYVGGGGALLSETRYIEDFGAHNHPFDTGNSPQNRLISGFYVLPISSYFYVPPDNIVVFEVRLEADYIVEDGSISLSFYDDTPSGFIICPALQIELLTAPAVTATPSTAAR